MERCSVVSRKQKSKRVEKYFEADGRAFIILKEWTVYQECEFCKKQIPPYTPVIHFIATCWKTKCNAHVPCWKEAMQDIIFQADTLLENRNKFDLLCVAERMSGGENGNDTA